MKYSLDQVITFINVVEAHSFTQAAKRMSLSKAIVSQRIKALEEHLETQLFIRTTRKLSLTDAGQIFFDNVKSIGYQIESSIEDMRSHQKKAKGPLKLIIPSGAATVLGEKIIPNFIKDNPEVELNVQVAGHPLSHLDKQFDCLLTPHIKGMPLPDMNLVAKSLVIAPVGIYATQAYLDKHGTPQSPADLSEHHCLATFEGPWPFKESDQPIHFVNVSGKTKTNNDAFMHKIVNDGLALCYTYSRLFTQEIKKKEIVSLLRPYLNLQTELYALFPQYQHMPYKLRVLLDTLEKHYKKEQKLINSITP